MKKKNQRKLIKILKELNLYKKVDFSMTCNYGDKTAIINESIYMPLNDVIDWEELIS